MVFLDKSNLQIPARVKSLVSFSAWFKNVWFWVTVDGESWFPHGHVEFVWRWVLVESFESEQFQPMWVGVAIEQFGRTLADSLRSIAACILVVVEEETQQIQIVVADVPPQEEVIPQAAIEILDSSRKMCWN